MGTPPLATYLLNAFLLAVVIIQLLHGSAGKIGLIDVPKGRKLHDGAVPLTGGIAMFAAFLVPAVNLQFALGIHWQLLVGLSLLVGLGVLDDIFNVNPWLKLSGQTAAALVMVLPEATFIGPAQLIGITHPEPTLIALPFTVFFVVGIINAYNMIDGLDGLAGGAAATALVWMIVAGWLAGPAASVVEPLLVLFAVLGFLIFNLRHRWRPRAAVFMGDAGSMMLGGAIAFFTVNLAANGTGDAPPPAALLWFFALPAFDTLLLIGRRIADGRSPLVGDRRHLHHLLLEAGVPPEQATALVVAASGLLGAIGFLGWRIGTAPDVLFFGLTVPFALHFYFVCHGWKRLRLWVSRRAGPLASLATDGFNRIEDRAA